MRTNIVIDDALMKEAMDLSKLRTKRDVVQKALEDYVHDLKVRRLQDIRGKVHFSEGYDPKAARSR
ncbi:MAG: type II toxin-antitoxin system VapB family antitoxin [Acidobacteriota bacterium]|nr:type II toxin-antitoxin system VapB family antitoxin [Acidobacteriota bacterium]